DKAIILPNNKNIVMAAEQATRLANGKTAIVIPTMTIPQGIAALLGLDPTGTLDTVAEAMRSASQSVQTGEVTTATPSGHLNGVKVKQGQIIGLHNDELRIAGNDIPSVVLDLLGVMSADKLELITLYFGEGVKKPDAEALIQQISATYPGHDVELK